VEQKLSTGLGQGQVAVFVEDDEVHPGQMLGELPLTSIAGLDLEPIDEVDYLPRAEARMQLLAMAIARWVLPMRW
jgi:hypothetical protein